MPARAFNLDRCDDNNNDDGDDDGEGVVEDVHHVTPCIARTWI